MLSRTSLIVGGIIVSLVMAEVVLFHGPSWRRIDRELQETWLGSLLQWSADLIIARAECPCPCSSGRAYLKEYLLSLKDLSPWRVLRGLSSLFIKIFHLGMALVLHLLMQLAWALTCRGWEIIFAMLATVSRTAILTLMAVITTGVFVMTLQWSAILS